VRKNLIFLFFIINSFTYPEIILDGIIYQNNFENNNDDQIDGASFLNCNSSNLLGNFNGFEVNDKPDKWIIEINPGMDLYKDDSVDKYLTTFSNSPCWPDYCLRQSYLNVYLNENNPKTGSDERNLTEICNNSFFGEKTTLYKNEKTFKQSGNAIIIRFYDELYLPNAIDNQGINQEICDESWSMDNLKVRIINYE